ncbi:Band 7 protein [Shewanella piezotolerans WP3]|uniref:Band 7 protein n=1 Tax=Shewanella piezotolerans (strain WP3 / JCM 13877) TaxID=225849 RepID=B8CJH5_SHEPW|nr:Band 7 protein [Shewanella piezotolerans WP3]
MVKKWSFPFKTMQSRSGKTEVLTKCGFQNVVCFIIGFGYRITISSNPTICLQRFEFPLNGQTFNAIGISFDFHAVIGIRANTVKDVVEDFGAENWYPRFVRETFRTYVRDEVQKYDSRALKENRSRIADSVANKLTAYLEPTPFEITNIVVGNINYPAIVATAVEKKLAAQQLLSEKATQKEIAQKDAEIRIEEAKGIAEAQKIINTTLTANYLQHEAINAQRHMADSPNHTTVYIPVGTNGIPLIKQSN